MTNQENNPKEALPLNGNNKETLSPEEKTKILEKTKISLSLDDYNDIFSDFDPRPYSQRSLSDDFLIEAKKASRDKKTGEIELNLLMPKEKRNFNHEHTIKNRLKDYFKRREESTRREIKKIIHQGAIFIGIGVVLMIIATILIHYYYETNIFLSFLVILLEPAGWFLFWEGLNFIIFKQKEKNPEFEFNQKMSKSTIIFSSL